MALVCFEKLKLLMPSDVMGIGGSDTTPRGPVTGDINRPTVYDPVWGYIEAFGQQDSFTYNEAETYLDGASFTITGKFTVNAEAGTASPSLSDSDAFVALTSKLEALRASFDAAAAADAPSDYTKWGTSQDSRCIPLPQPLLDKDGNRVYGLPVSIEVSQTRFPVEISYRATLSEAKFPLVKGSINGQVVDRLVISISPPKPIIYRHSLVGTYGEVLQLRNYTTTEFEISGSLPTKTGVNGKPVNGAILSFIAGLEAGHMDLGAVSISATGTANAKTAAAWAALDVESGSIEMQYKDHEAGFSVRARI